jgi:hypothetical protein
MRTEDGYELRFEVPFWIVCIENFPMDVGTNQELALYTPIKAVVHKGAAVNLFGRRIFYTETAAIEWCELNKPKEK